MSDPQTQRLDEVALFRYGLIADLLRLPPGSRETAVLLRQKAERSYVLPHSQRCTVAAETLRHWLKLYRRGGIDALKPTKRADTGVSRSLPQPVADLLCEMKHEDPHLSVQLLIKQAQQTGRIPAELPIPPSTVHRLLTRAGLMQRQVAQGKDHRRFGFEQAGELWMSDVMHGPSVGVGGKVRRKSYLIAFIDDATRVVPYAAFALSENTQSFLPQLKQAIMRRGVPKRLYVDNGSAFRSHQLQLVCAKLGITLIHARPYHPQAKGKQERWFRTVRMQLLPGLRAEDTACLANLNQRLWGWVEGEYHRSPHRGLDGLTPLDAWAARSQGVVPVDGHTDLDAMFLFEQRRKVARDRTVSLHGTVYEVDTLLVGTAVLLRYDPQDAHAAVQVWADNKRHSDARPVDIYANRLVKREGPQAPPLRMRELGALPGADGEVA